MWVQLLCILYTTGYRIRIAKPPYACKGQCFKVKGVLKQDTTFALGLHHCTPRRSRTAYNSERIRIDKSQRRHPSRVITSSAPICFGKKQITYYYYDTEVTLSSTKASPPNPDCFVSLPRYLGQIAATRTSQKFPLSLVSQHRASHSNQTISVQ